MSAMMLPADSHVHSEWSWDTGGPSSEAAGRMRATCAQAVRIGLPVVIFTEHLDIPGTWRAEPGDLMPNQRGFIGPDGTVGHPAFDADGYFESVDRCRHEFPGLRVLTGVEFGQPHLFEAEAARLVDLGRLDRVNGSLHTLGSGPVRAEPGTLYRERPADEVMRAYLAEVPVMVNGSAAFEVFTHIDYAVRMWPAAEIGPFDPRRFEEEFRYAMRAIADGDRALEMNTRRLWPWIPQWWAEEGGRAISFGSDAHLPEALAANFPEATAMAEHYGFRPGLVPEAFWTR
jgi:histidinol-phosphatase (PHP family)